MPESYYVSKYSGEEIDALLGGAGAGTVRYDAAQSLTDAQKQQARTNIAAAPSGFGLGENRTIGPMMSVVTADTLDTTYNNGWYFANGVNIAGFTQAVVRVDSSGRTIFQTAFVALNNYILRRYLVDTVGTAPNNNFSPWEWVNPPMKLGVEYRTTERYLGKPVYKRTENIGAMPAPGNYKQVQIPYNGDTNYLDNVNICANSITYWGLVMPVYNSYNSVTYSISTNMSGVITLTAASGNTDLSGNGAVYVTVKYTKTTD